MQPDVLLPANLKERSLLRKVAKKLGLKASASPAQVLRAIDHQVKLKQQLDQEAAARGTTLPPAPDPVALRSALDHAVMARSVAQAAAGPFEPPAIALPEVLDALRVRQEHATDGAAAVGR